MAAIAAQRHRRRLNAIGSEARARGRIGVGRTNLGCIWLHFPNGNAWDMTLVGAMCISRARAGFDARTCSVALSTCGISNLHYQGFPKVRENQIMSEGDVEATEQPIYDKIASNAVA